MRNQRDNSWILFKNNRKTSEKHCDYTGEITINGEEFWLNGWVREGKSGKFLGGTIRPKQQRQLPKVVGGTDFDDEIPF